MSTQSRCLSKVRSKLVAMIEKGEIPSMAVAVAQGGKILWEEALGWSNRDTESEATFDTIYPIASISKSLTATGIMVLVEQEKVGLDDPVEEYITPSRLNVYEGKSSEVTVRRVLNMTSGIPHGYMVYKDPDASPILREFVNRYGIVVFPPGELELYSNFSYAVLALIIENVTDKSFKRFMKTEVFNPLSLTQTSVGLPNSPELLATKYNSENSVIAHNYFVPAAAGGIYSSIHDLIRFGMFHLKNHLPNQKRIVDDEKLTMMLNTKEEHLKSPVMALGWGSVTLDDDVAWIFSNGGIEGATSMLSLVPSANLAVACLTNVTSKSRITDQIAIEITEAWLPNFSKSVETFMKRYEAENSPTSHQPAPNLVGLWEGKIKTQETETPVKLVFHENGEVHINLGDLHETILNNACFGNNQLKGCFKGLSPFEMNITDEHVISIQVKVKGNRMYGVATTDLVASRGLLSPSYIYLDKNNRAQC